MPHFPYRSRQAVLAGLILLAGPAAAQAPKPVISPPAPLVPAPVAPVPAAPPATVAPPVPPAVIDPAVRTLFNQAIAAQQALAAVSATITTTSTGLKNAAAQTITLAFQKPGKARIAVAAGAGPIVQFVCDGKTLTIYMVQEKKYQVNPVPPGADVIPAVLVQARALLPRLIGRPEELTELLAQPGVTASLGIPETVGSVPVDRVNITLPTPDGGKVQFVFDLGKTDHLLRQIAQTAVIPNPSSASADHLPQTFTHTETVTALETAPVLTAADFIFTPPPGVTKAVMPKAAVPQTAPPVTAKKKPKV